MRMADSPCTTETNSIVMQVYSNKDLFLKKKKKCNGKTIPCTMANPDYKIPKNKLNEKCLGPI